MEMTKKPTLDANIYLDDRICYALQEYHDKLKQIGNFCSTVHVPLIHVSVIIERPGHNYYWKNYEHPQITEYEARTNQHPEEAEINPKLFPAFIPITCFKDAQSGTILSLVIHGYKTKLTCSVTKYIRPSALTPEDLFVSGLNTMMQNFESSQIRLTINAKFLVWARPGFEIWTNADLYYILNIKLKTSARF